MSNRMKRITALGVGIVTVISMSGVASLALPIATQAQTASEIQAQIDSLMATITALNAQLAALQGTTSTTGAITGVPAGFIFTKLLKQGSKGDDVKYLQIVLNSQGQDVGTADGSFGRKTKAGAMKFQESKGLVADGVVGKNTNAALNAVLASSTTTTTPPADDTTTPPVTDTTTPPVTDTTSSVTGDMLQIEVTSDTPKVASVATGGNANFTKLLLSAGDKEVSISKIYVTQSGQSVATDVENIKIVDENSINLGTTGSLDANLKSLISFSPVIKISAGKTKTVFIRSGVTAAAVAGRTVQFGIASKDDVTATSPVTVASGTGNAMTVLSLTIATVTVNQDGATSNSAPDVGKTDVVVNRFKIENNSVEPVTIESLEVEEAGTASLTDTGNIELWSVTDNKSLGEVASWSASGRAAFTGVNLKLVKGVTHRLQIRLDIKSGVGQTINADIIDGSDVLVIAKGDTYGYYITPTNGAGWTNANAGRGSADQTIASGAVIVSRSSASAAVGNVAQADNQDLATFELDVRGEQVRITSFRVAFYLDTDGDGVVDSNEMTDSQISNVRILDHTNNQTHGPYSVTTTDLPANSTTYQATVTTTDLIILPVGVHKFTVSGKIATATSALDTILASIPDPDSGLTIRGDVSNDSITASPSTSNISGNTQTVQAGSLVAVTSATTPAAQSIAAGAQDVLLLVASLNATGSGENVEVSSIIVEDTINLAASKADDWTGLEVWADITSSSSARGDAYETRVATAPSGQPDDTAVTDELVTFTFTQNIIVPKASFVNIAVLGDLKSSATANETHTWSLDEAASAVVANGVSTGSTISVTPTGAGQVLTVAASGVITATVDSSRPNSQLVAGGDTGVTVAIFRLAASNVESHDLNDFQVTSTGTDNAMTAYHFYASKRADGKPVTDPIASVPGGANTAGFTNLKGVVTIPVNDYVLITVKADIPLVDGTTVTNGSTLIATVATTGDIDTVGLSSGVGTDPTVGTALTPPTHYVYKAYPKFALNASSPSGSLIPGALQKVAIFDVTAVGNDDVTFDGTVGGDSNTLTLSWTAISADNTLNDAFELRKKDGTKLASPADVNINASTTVVFTFEDAVFTVPKGMTEELHVYADTDGLTADGNTIQVFFDDVATHISFSVNSGTTNASRGDIIFQGEVRAKQLLRDI